MAKGWTCGRCQAANDEAAVSCRTCGMIRGGVVAAPNPVAQPPVGSQWVAGRPPGWSAPASSATANRSGAPADAPPVPDPGASAPVGWPVAPEPVPAAGAKRRAATGLLASLGIRGAVIVAFLVVGAVVTWFTAAGRNSSGQIDKAGELAATDLKIGDCFDLPGDSATFDANATVDKTTAMPCTQPHHYEVFYSGTMTDSGTYPTDTEFTNFVDANCTPAFEGYVGTPIDQTSLTFVYFYPEAKGWSAGDRSVQCSLADPKLKALTKSMKGSGY